MPAGASAILTKRGGPLNLSHRVPRNLPLATTEDLHPTCLPSASTASQGIQNILSSMGAYPLMLQLPDVLKLAEDPPLGGGQMMLDIPEQGLLADWI